MKTIAIYAAICFFLALPALLLGPVGFLVTVGGFALAILLPAAFLIGLPEKTP
jgi:hypothetical protein